MIDGLILFFGIPLALGFLAYLFVSRFIFAPAIRMYRKITHVNKPMKYTCRRQEEPQSKNDTHVDCDGEYIGRIDEFDSGAQNELWGWFGGWPGPGNSGKSDTFEDALHAIKTAHMEDKVRLTTWDTPHEYNIKVLFGFLAVLTLALVVAGLLLVIVLDSLRFTN